MDWQPSPDEDLLIRASAKFATGLAPAVAGCRWFRDTGRHDIQGDLPNWPPGPAFTLRSTSDRAARRTGRALLVGIPLIANIVASIGGALGSPLGDVTLQGDPEEPENEVEDFPVMWAAPGTLARTVPWQLDPSRRPEDYLTDMVLTTRRLVFLSTRTATPDKAEELWGVPRNAIAGAEQMKFSEIGGDIRITFADGSWIRLFTGSPESSERLSQLLTGSIQGLIAADLTDGQRERVQRFQRDVPENAEAPTFTRLKSGIVQVECRAPAKAAAGFFETHGILMDASGAPAVPKPGDL
ncbi:hypothetical protein AB0M87_12370 [Streptomyces sp. NPDC051320]|uniref:hypothetical protein n=1 Tax=Streptomyces sp. NPDC051320 TaxID=3154644 RepID=UPI0034490766